MGNALDMGFRYKPTGMYHLQHPIRLLRVEETSKSRRKLALTFAFIFSHRRSLREPLPPCDLTSCMISNSSTLPMLTSLPLQVLPYDRPSRRKLRVPSASRQL